MKAFVSVVRLLAQFAREPESEDTRTAIDRCYTLREIINSKFDEIRSIADSVPFEFGPTRQQDLASRDHIRRWQPQFRTLFVMRIASTKYRLRLAGFELPHSVQLWHREYDLRSANLLDDMANWVEGTGSPTLIPGSALDEMKPVLPLAENESPPSALSFIVLIRSIDNITRSIAKDIGRTMAVTK